LSPTIRAGFPLSKRWKPARTKFIGHLNPPGEVVEIPYELGKPICGYFIQRAVSGDKLPVLICMGGLDSIKTRCGSCRPMAACSAASRC